MFKFVCTVAAAADPLRTALAADPVAKADKDPVAVFKFVCTAEADAAALAALDVAAFAVLCAEVIEPVILVTAAVAAAEPLRTALAADPVAKADKDPVAVFKLPCTAEADAAAFAAAADPLATAAANWSAADPVAESNSA